jgi:hypothetical protein
LAVAAPSNEARIRGNGLWVGPVTIADASGMGLLGFDLACQIPLTFGDSENMILGFRQKWRDGPHAEWISCFTLTLVGRDLHE